MSGLPALVATDLDHTLLRSDRSVSDRTAVALDAVRQAGVPVVPVTARNTVGVRALDPRAGLSGWALCGNGAYGYNLDTDELLYSVELAPQILQSVAGTVVPQAPGVRFATVRDAGCRFTAEDGYAALASFADHSRDPAEMERAALAEQLRTPALKMIFRHPDLPAEELFAAVSDAVSTRCDAEITLSGAPFVEVMAAGVSKASGLARLCSHLGVDRADVLAFGDGINDIDMLQWAGRGVAVANAQDAVLAVADEVTAAADDDGVAQVLERVLR